MKTSDYDMATHALGHSPSGNKTAKKPKVQPMKEFHAKELHDGTYHVQMHHGHDEMGMPVKPMEEGSSPDVEGVHVHLHEHFGGSKAEGPHDGEGEGTHGEENEGAGEKKQGHEQKAKHEKEKPEPEGEEKPGDAEEDEK